MAFLRARAAVGSTKVSTALFALALIAACGGRSHENDPPDAHGSGATGGVGGAVGGGDGGSSVPGGTGGAVSSGGAGGTGGAISGIPPITITCGNGEYDLGESCDDGNRFDGDCCTQACEIEVDCRCPDLPEVGPCDTLAYCGNGLVTSFEACDDGNTSDGDGCSRDCRTVTPGWRCRAPGKACAPFCGDSLMFGAEACDDGGRISGDGCSATCRQEPGWRCTSAPSACTQSVCGNGVAEPGESCDLGQENGVYDGTGDGCSATCTPEPTCVANTCTSACGDGNVDLATEEQCDDGNQFSGDGCSIACAIEAGYTCENQERPDLTIGTECLPRCGDEIVTVTEECDDGEAASDTDGVVNEDGAYGGCDTQCRLGPHCGDGTVFGEIDSRTNGPYEQCDQGADNSDVYGVVDGCSPSCRLTPFCGDGVIDAQFGETCDDGPENGGPHCRFGCSVIG